jgi:hypothetical protein
MLEPIAQSPISSQITTTGQGASHGHVTMNEQPASQRFHRFVDEKIKNWMRIHNLADKPSEYEVAFFDEEPMGEVSCLVVIQSGRHLWRSWETADNARIALSRSIENLKADDDDEAKEIVRPER